MDFIDFQKNNIVIFDGAMGTMLQENGLKLGEVPERLNLDNPQLIEKIHKQYIQAGANVITANTFGANNKKMEDAQLDFKEIIKAGISIAKKATNGFENTFVAQDIGPIGELLSPLGTLSFDDAYEIFKQQILIGKENGTDLFLIETMTDLYETKAALLAVKENSNIPVICTMTFEQNGRTFTGCEISSMAVTLEALGADGVGINCSLGPDEIFSFSQELLKWTNLPILVQPNAGLPDLSCDHLKYDISPSQFASSIEKYLNVGITMVGGCCGTTPEYIFKIKELVKSFKEKNNLIKRELFNKTCVCTPSRMVVIDTPKIIGERINPTGKKLFKQALIEKNMGYILNQAIEQQDGGADILDINVGLPQINEKQMMEEVVTKIQEIIDLPLQLDSSDPIALERGLRIYNGKCIINSVNGDDDVLDSILPLVKKYGACVVGLTLNKNGIPQKAEDRIAIAQYILDKAISYGIKKQDVFIDCLTLTASAQQKEAYETIKALKIVSQQMKLKTVLGVSNISFGLPNREAINRTFLSIALENGLTLPIINPNARVMTETVLCHNLLKAIDKNSEKYIQYQVNNPIIATQAAIKSEKPIEENVDSQSIFYTIKKGLKDQTATLTTQLLKNHNPEDIINNFLIPALDEVGEQFEKQILFLPQLISAAEAAKFAFDEIKKILDNNGTSRKKGEKIIVATVEGDVHDIGKNIVKVILENYGFNVIDLGKNVPPQLVVDTAIKQNVKLVGLSALMTTTLKSMEATINLLKQSGHKCKIMVGGAVLTEDYAIKIGADFYAKDAKQSVKIAKEVLL
ncbi:MAG: homocysteine S-methyltransferase family protein [Oscillospiraceae bacterium]